MSKNNRGEKEYSRLQTALHDNRKLKREINSLRKQLARLDLDRHGYVRDILQEHYDREDSENLTMDKLEKLRSQWKCRECHEGHLEIVVYTKINDTWYFRQCNNCKHRTKSQKYTPDVKGLIKPPENDEKVPVK